MCSAIDAVVWTRDLYRDIRGDHLEIQVYTDCKSVEKNSKSLRLQVTERRLTNYMWNLRDVLEQGEIKPLVHVTSDFMLADGLTNRNPRRRDILDI